MKRKRRWLQYNAPVTLTFALLSFALLLLDFLTGGVSTRRLFCVYRSSLADPLTYFRFFTHTLGHSGFSHYSGNMMLLLVLGPSLEERYGSRMIFWSMMATAFVSGLLQWLLFPGTALLGASGIIFMMILMSSLGGSRGDGLPLTLLLVFVIYVGSEIYSAITASDNVSHLTHIVGGCCGAVIGLGLRQKK